MRLRASACVCVHGRGSWFVVCGSVEEKAENNIKRPTLIHSNSLSFTPIQFGDHSVHYSVRIHPASYSLGVFN